MDPANKYTTEPHPYGSDTYITKDSGEREDFDTGSRRDSRTGKGRFDLLPFRAIRRLAGVYERGAKKYGDRNWELGQPQSRFLDSALRHMADYAEGKRDEDHLAQAAFNVMAMIDQEERKDTLPEELFDVADHSTDHDPA